MLPFVEVRLFWASRHRWRAGDALRGFPAPVYALWFVLQGCVDVGVAERRWHVPAGTAFFSPPHLPRDIVVPQGAEWLSVGLTARLFEHVDLLQAVDAPLLWTPDDGERNALATWMQQLEHAGNDTQNTFTNPDSARMRPAKPSLSLAADVLLVREGLVRALFGVCWRRLDLDRASQRAHPEVPGWLARTLAHVHREPDSTLDDLTKAAGVGTSQLRRGFHQWLGTSPQAYLTKRRLEEARQLLETGDLVVRAVAERVGFSSLSHFTRLFKQTYGAPPARFRQEARRPTV